MVCFSCEFWWFVVFKELIIKYVVIKLFIIYFIIPLTLMGSVAMIFLSFLIWVTYVLSLFSWSGWLKIYQLHWFYQRTSCLLDWLSLSTSCFHFHWFLFKFYYIFPSAFFCFVSSFLRWNLLLFKIFRLFCFMYLLV